MVTRTRHTPCPRSYFVFFCLCQWIGHYLFQVIYEVIKVIFIVEGCHRLFNDYRTRFIPDQIAGNCHRRLLGDQITPQSEPNLRHKLYKPNSIVPIFRTIITPHICSDHTHRLLTNFRLFSHILSWLTSHLLLVILSRSTTPFSASTSRRS